MDETRSRVIQDLYRNSFLPSRDEDWLRNYREAIEEVASADEAKFKSADFQRRLWEWSDVSSLGPGNAVTVQGAYGDAAIADTLWRLRNDPLPQDVMERARYLDAQFNHLISLVTPRYNARRPSARLVRLFAVLRPDDVHCLVDWNKTADFRAWLGLPLQKLHIIGQHVISRQALRDALGPESTPDDQVSYSQFAWYVWQHVIRKADPASDAAVPAQPAIATDTPSLELLPASAQRKGINYLTNNLTLLLSMLRAAEHGIDRQTLDHLIEEEAPMLKNTSRSNLISQAATLGLLALDNGSYRPTASGQELLEGAAPAEMLTPVMVRSIFGFAQILDDLGRESTLTRGRIAQLCRDYYPRWTTDFAPNQLVAWMRDLGLVQVDGVGSGADVSLTDDGEYWRSGLPDHLKSPAFLLSDERPDEKPIIEEVAAQPIAATEFVAAGLAEIIESFRHREDLRSLVFDDRQIALIHAALHATEGKRFILLAGLSGTGKTSMARGYAHAYCAALGLNPDAHYEQVAVWPDWTDPTGLLGFVNPLANPPSFQETSALRLVLNAVANPSEPYFLCLDEMNLARVEHYFAPFLSAMEGQSGRLAIHQAREPIDAVPPAVAWPKNLFIIGTVNMDETTHPFSDKVLDRAFTFEFWQVDLHGWRRSAQARGASEAVLSQIFPVLEVLSDALEPARRHFGYRTCDEILGFVSVADEVGRHDALDAAVFAKILPKVRGDSGVALERAIGDAIRICADHKLAETGKKLLQMQSTLKTMGFVRFWS